jgi:tRNA nucleotidyltransferase (CCA-adding enzyme)
MSEHTFDAAVMLERVRELPGGRELLDLARGRADVALVGGAVRDLALGRDPRELDVVVGVGEAASPSSPALLFAREFAARLNTLAGTTEHGRFGTALVSWDGARVDVASARRERYAVPGALPEVEPATLDEDLLRRDFTANAIAVTLDTTRPGEVHAPPGALEDLRAGRLRVLHDASFRDDPTRLLRLARYAARLDFAIESHTAALASQAVASHALDTISGARIGAELRLALSEPDAIAALAAMENLGLFKALHPRLRFDERLARTALEELSFGMGAERNENTPVEPTLRGRLLLAALLQPMLYGLEEGAEAAAGRLLNALEFPAADRDLVLMAAICADAVADELAGAEAASEVYEAASHVSIEGIALASAWARQEWPLSDAPIAAQRWLREVRHVRLLITGEDLLAAGIPEGPEVGRKLDAALARKLDGELTGERQAELRAALEA